MSTTEPLRPPHPHEVCGTCAYIYAPGGSVLLRRCGHPHKRIWSPHIQDWVDPARDVTGEQGCQCWEARGEEEGER